MSLIVHILAHECTRVVAVLLLMDCDFRGCCNKVSLRWLRSYLSKSAVVASDGHMAARHHDSAIHQ